MNLICKVCKNKNIRLWANKNSWNLYKCGECGLIFTDENPKISELYSKDYFKGAKDGFGYVDYDKDKLAMTGTFNFYLDKIEKIMPNRGSLLDIGAATGYFLKIARQRNWKVKGIEISDYASQKAKTEGLDVITGTLENANLADESFNVLTFFDVLEHFSDPKSQLLIANKILKNSGLIIINTPDSNSLVAKILGRHWHLLIPPEHLVIFSLNNLSILLKSCGFEILLVNKIGKRFTLQYIFQISANWRRSALLGKAAEFLKNNFLGSFSFPINLRDNFFIIAKKL